MDCSGIVTPIGLALFVVALLIFSAMLPVVYDVIHQYFSRTLEEGTMSQEERIFYTFSMMLPGAVIIFMVVWWLIYAGYA